MPMRTMMLRALACVVAAFSLMAGPALAAGYPDRPVHWIVPYPPGGTTDLLARLIGQYLSEHLGQTFVIENLPGARANIGTEAVGARQQTATRCSWSRPRT